MIQVQHTPPLISAKPTKYSNFNSILIEVFITFSKRVTVAKSVISPKFRSVVSRKTMLLYQVNADPLKSVSETKVCQNI